MRNSIRSDLTPTPAHRDRKIVRRLLLAGAALCLAMSVLHIEPSASSLAGFVARGGASVSAPLMNAIRRRTSW